MPTISQVDFSGGMSALVDSTKTQANQFRLGLNTDIRGNGLQGFFRPIKCPSPPTYIHQALFAIDDKLMLVAAGDFYKYNPVSNSFAPIATSVVLDATADVIYHQAIPAPNNKLVDGNYTTKVATYQESVVLQDGTNRPALLFFSLGSRHAKTYTQWTPEDPEYIPIGKQMCYSGNVLYVVSKDGRKIYRSVSGRPTDFVLNIDNNGNKQGDADTTNLTISAAATTVVAPAQHGGIIVGTKEQTYQFIPDPESPTIFGEVYLRPKDLFPVGVVDHRSFGYVNGRTVFVAPMGIQMFDQVAQMMTNSQNSPFGAPIQEYLNLPFTSSAIITENDYMLIAVSTKFGDGVLVYDGQLEAIAGFALVGTVKEFARVVINGRPRVFFITTANEVYEMPIWGGERMAWHAYLGELNSGDANTGIRVTDVHLAFNEVRTAGNVVVSVYRDKQLDETKQKELSSEDLELSTTTPSGIPHGVENPANRLTFEVGGKFGFASGVQISSSADSRLVAATIEIESAATPIVGSSRVYVPLTTHWFAAGLIHDTKYTASTVIDSVVGRRYVTWRLDAGHSTTNGSRTEAVHDANRALCFKALSDKLLTAATTVVYDYATVQSWLTQIGRTDHVSVVGGLSDGVTFRPTAALLDQHNITPDIVCAPADCTLSAEGVFNEYQRPDYYIVEDDFVAMYYISFPLTETEAEVDANGDLINIPTPNWLQRSGFLATWLRANLALRPGKFNVVCLSLDPRTYSALEWPWRPWGVDVVVAAGTKYQRVFEAGVHYLLIGDISSALGPAFVKFQVGQSIIQAVTLTADGTQYDRFSVLG